MTQQTTNTSPAPDALRNRYVFDGKLEMRTGLHIGGGKLTLSHSDNPVVVTPDGLPFIPGSSFKGVLRSTIEKLVASLPTNLGLRTCGLPVGEHPEVLCPTAHPEKIARERRQSRTQKDVEQVLERERKNLCDTCKLFGSPLAAARITVNDLYLLDEQWSGTTQVRDGVAIDRDSETAKRTAKYDFEVVPVATVFGLHLVIENATRKDLQLISIGLSEFMNGFGGVGGLRSRGLGACILDGLQIRYMEVTDANRQQRLQRYLLRKKDGTDDGLDPIEKPQDFIDDHIKVLFEQTPSQL